MNLSNLPTPWWLPERHTQTLWRRFARTTRVHRLRERFTLSDGDFVDLDHLCAASGDVEKPLVVLLHGLCGSSDSAYIHSTQALLHSNGYDSVGVNYRGCSGEVNNRARAYHSGATDDVTEIVVHLYSQAKRPIVLIGFSLGANIALRYLFEHPSSSVVQAAIAVSTPFSLAKCSRALTKGLSKSYGQYFKRQLVADLNRKKRHFKNTGNHAELEKLNALGDLSTLTDLWDFDDRVTAPLHGFKDADDYYSRCSSGLVLDKIAAPVHLIQSANDPFIPIEALPDASTLPDHIRLQCTDNGGHVGFPHRDEKQWLEKQILEALTQLCA
ncbi:MAG: alpha/beta fold hydrolase [Pseudohongiellaceae bacterium]|nr:alpha/beta fold hydrolase [Pseudohongiellaceae bacterium]